MTDYPSPKQQKRYILLGSVAMLLVVTTLLTAFSVS
ncbi:MAG: photosystem II assembly protein Psb34 [Waterburya sp.]